MEVKCGKVIGRQAGSLESIIFDGAKRILGCSSKTCNKRRHGLRHIAEP